MDTIPFDKDLPAPLFKERVGDHRNSPLFVWVGSNAQRVRSNRATGIRASAPAPASIVTVLLILIVAMQVGRPQVLHVYKVRVIGGTLHRCHRPDIRDPEARIPFDRCDHLEGDGASRRGFEATRGVFV